MHMRKKVGVTVPTHNEEKFIAEVIRGIPEFVDRIYVVNDASTDNSLQIMLDEAKRNSRVCVIDRKSQGGVGAAILSGHSRALEEGMDVLVVIAGDGQMDPAFLDKMITPVIEGRAEYVKGNRLATADDRKEMPLYRVFGNFVLTSLTRMASGYWHVSDPQNGYTAISADALRKLELKKIEPGFAFENDMLVKLNATRARVMDVQHPAIYRGQQSKIRGLDFVVRTSWILLKDFVWRIWAKYLKASPLPGGAPHIQRNIQSD